MESLPAEFDTPAFIDVAASLKIPQKTAEKYITEFVKKGLIHRDTFGKYLNSPKTDNRENGELEED